MRIVFNKAGLNKIAPHHAEYLIEVYQSLPHICTEKVDRNIELMRSALVNGATYSEASKAVGSNPGTARATIEGCISRTIKRQKFKYISLWPDIRYGSEKERLIIKSGRRIREIAEIIQSLKNKIRKLQNEARLLKNNIANRK